MIKNTKLQRTILLIGEGDNEAAFLEHLQALYVSRYSGLTITILSGHGGGPRHLLEYTIRRKAPFNTIAIVLDSDIPLPENFHQNAQKGNVNLILLEPLCFDGFLLKILGEKIPTSSSSCKTKLQKILKNDPCEKTSYAKLFPKNLLEKERRKNSLLNRLLNLFE